MPAIYLVTLLTLIAQGCHMGSRMVASLFAIELGANPLLIGVLISAYSAFPLLLAVYSGRLSDRFGARRPMIAGTAILACRVSTRNWSSATRGARSWKNAWPGRGRAGIITPGLAPSRPARHEPSRLTTRPWPSSSAVASP